MAMLGPEELQIVRREIDDQQAPARLQDTRCFSDHAMRRIYTSSKSPNDLRFIVLARDPVMRAFSEFALSGLVEF